MEAVRGKQAMGLRGSLAGIKLSDIFQMLAMSQQEQTLIVRREHDKRIFHFAPGTISVFLSMADETAMLGEILIGLGYLNEQQMSQALDEQSRKPGRRVGQILIDLALCQTEQVNEALKLQVESAIYDLLSWDSGSFEVKEGPPDPADIGEASRLICVSFDPAGLLMEAARRMDEWEGIRQVIPSMDLVLCRTAERDDELPPEDSSLLTEKILAFVDGSRMVRDIGQACRLPLFQVCAALAQLLKQGRVRLATTEELFELIQPHFRTKDSRRALALCELIDRSADNDEQVLMRLGHIYERLDYNERAASALAAAGKMLFDAGRLSEAIDALDHASQLNRSDLSVKERLLSALNESGKVDRAVSIARVLSQAFFRRGEYARAREMCQFILSHRNKDEEARFLLTEIHLATGNVQAAAAESNILAHMLPYGEDRRLKMLRSRIERQDHPQPAAAEHSPTAAAVSAPTRGGRSSLTLLLIAALLLLVAAGGAWLWMERAAARARGDVDRHVPELIQQGRFAEAIAEYETIIESFPYTSTARQLRRLVTTMTIQLQQGKNRPRAARTEDSPPSLAEADEGR